MLTTKGPHILCCTVYTLWAGVVHQQLRLIHECTDPLTNSLISDNFIHGVTDEEQKMATKVTIQGLGYILPQFIFYLRIWSFVLNWSEVVDLQTACPEPVSTSLANTSIQHKWSCTVWLYLLLVVANAGKSLLQNQVDQITFEVFFFFIFVSFLLFLRSGDNVEQTSETN